MLRLRSSYTKKLDFTNEILKKAFDYLVTSFHEHLQLISVIINWIFTLYVILIRKNSRGQLGSPWGYSKKKLDVVIFHSYYSLLQKTVRF